MRAFSTITSTTSLMCLIPNIEEAIVDAVNLGGDADTTAAVAGALSGAHWGEKSIPERWSEKLNPYPKEKFIEIGNKLFVLASKQ
jgi:ADP-ribosyl-[dinitrogen reductase] hydrolase